MRRSTPPLRRPEDAPQVAHEDMPRGCAGRKGIYRPSTIADNGAARPAGRIRLKPPQIGYTIPVDSSYNSECTIYAQCVINGRPRG